MVKIPRREHSRFGLRARVVFLLVLIAVLAGLPSALADTGISSCGTLGSAGERYYLTADIIVNGTCFTITANNIILDGAGHSIQGNMSGYGVYINGPDNIQVINFDDIMTFNRGVYLRSSSSSIVRNNTMRENNLGVDTYSCSGLKIYENYLVGNTEEAIYLHSTANSYVENNTADTNDYGVRLQASDSNDILNNTIINSDENGIELELSDGNNIRYNNVTDTRRNGLYFDSDSSGNSVYFNYFCLGKESAGLYYDIKDEGSNSGDANTCDETSNWNDTGNVGCSYTCWGTCSSYYTTITVPAQGQSYNSTIAIRIDTNAIDIEYANYSIFNSSNSSIHGDDLTENKVGGFWYSEWVTTSYDDGLYNLSTYFRVSENCYITNTTYFYVDNTVPTVWWDWDYLNTMTTFGNMTVRVNGSEIVQCTLYLSGSPRINTSWNTSIVWHLNETDANYTVYASCQDRAENTNTTSTGWWRVDTRAPIITWNWDDLNSTIPVNYARISVILDEKGNCTLHFNGTNYVNTTNGTELSWMVTNINDGNYTHINVTCQDILGQKSNSSTVWLNVSKDIEPPYVEWLNWTDINSSTPRTNTTIRVNASEDVNCTLHVWNGTNMSYYANTTFSTNATWHLDLPNGNYTIFAKCDDVMENHDNTTTGWWNVDTLISNLEWNWTEINSTINKTETKICVSIGEVVNCTLHFNGTNYVNTTNGTNICWNIAGMGEGNYSTINVTCEDSLNNSNTTTNGWVEVDITPPVITIVSEQNTTIGGARYVFNVSTDEAAVCTLHFNGTDYDEGPSVEDCWNDDADPHPICSCNDLQNINTHLNWSYYLVNDIDCSDTRNWNGGAGFIPISYTWTQQFTGVIDGRNHTIYDLYINRSATYTGFVGLLSGGLYNLGIERGYVSGGTGDEVGGLVGWGQSGVIRKCFFKGEVFGNDNVGGLMGLLSTNGARIYDSYFEGNVSGDQRIGGVVGDLYGRVDRVYSVANATANIEWAGGIAGRADTARARILYSFAAGGAYNNGEYVGGISGNNIDSSFRPGTRYWDNPDDDVADGGSYAEADLGYFMGKDLAGDPFTTWDLNDTWKEMSSDFPRLRWEDFNMSEHIWLVTVPHDGNYTNISFTCRDLFGNEGYSPIYWLRFDVTPPTITWTWSINISSNATPVVVNLTTNEVTTGCNVMINGTNYTMIQDDAFTYHYNWGVSSDYNYSIVAYCNDTLNNTGESTLAWYRYDTQTPAVYWNWSDANTTTDWNRSTVRINGSEAITCTLYVNGTPYVNNTPSMWVTWYLNLADGNWTLNATCQDAVGYQNQTSTVWWYVNTSTPGLAWNWSDANSFTYYNSTTVGITADEEVNCTLYVNGTIYSNWTAYVNATNGTFITWNFTNMPEGNYTFYARCDDLADNPAQTGSVWWTIDRTPPTASWDWDDANTLTIYNDSLVAINGSEIINCTLHVNGTDYPIPENSSYVTYNLTLADGNWTINATCEDRAGSQVNLSSVWWLINTTLPGVDWNWSDMNSATMYNTTTVGVNASQNVNCTLYVNGTPYVNNNNSNYLTWSMELGDGNWSFTADCWDRLGHKASLPEAWWKIDANPPTLWWNWTDANSSTLLGNSTVVINASETVNCTLFINGTAYPNSKLGRQITWNVSVTNGNWSLNVTCEDLAGYKTNSTTVWWDVYGIVPTYYWTWEYINHTEYPGASVNISLEMNMNGDCILHLNDTQYDMNRNTLSMIKYQYWYDVPLSNGNWSITANCTTYQGMNISLTPAWLDVSQDLSVRIQRKTTIETTEVEKVVNRTIDVIKRLSLKISAPSQIRIEEPGIKLVGVTVTNDGEVNLSGIKIGYEMDADIADVSISETDLGDLLVGEVKGFDVVMDNPPLVADQPAHYTITLRASSDEPKISRETSIEVVLYPYLEGNQTEMQAKMRFASDLMEKNPPCMEYAENLEYIRKKLEEGDFNTADRMLDEIIESCKDLISASQAVSVVAPAVVAPTADPSSYFLLGSATVAIAILLLLKANSIFRRRKVH